MMDNNRLSHTGAGGSNSDARMKAAGYEFTGNWAWAENIALRGKSGNPDISWLVEEQHKNLLESSGHRRNLLREDFREIGIGIVTKNSGSLTSAWTTQNFAKSGSNVFLTGVAFDDKVKDDNFYTVGEGLKGIEVKAIRQSDNKAFSTKTYSSGGYQMALDSGKYNITFSGGELDKATTKTITIGSNNVKLDLETNGLGSNLIATSLPTSFPAPAPDVYNITLVKGSSTDDKLLGDPRSQIIKGFGGNDNINSGAGNDRLYGGKGNDKLIGGRGNDKVIGGPGSDILIGVNSTQVNPGVGEVDLLEGKTGADIFVLGDAEGAYYKGQGKADYAKIIDFNLGEDLIQLHGSADNYKLVGADSSTKILYGEADSEPNELIGIVKGVSSGIELSEAGFRFV
jgi:Ca2+-binding RTX toxin-like protein